MDKKKLILIIIAILLVIGGITIIVNMGNKKESQEEGKVVINEIEFSNITHEYSGGITTVRAIVKNNTEETKNINVKVILKDKEGKVLIETQQKLENIEAGRKKLLAAGIMGDYSNVDKIELKEIK